MFFTSFRESAGMQILECVSVGTKVISLNATGASSWFENPLVQFVGPHFCQSRKELVNKFCDVYIDAKIASSSSALDYKQTNLESNLMFSEQKVFERILSIFKESFS